VITPEHLDWTAIHPTANLLVFLLRDELSTDLDLSALSAAELKRGQQYRLPARQRQFFFTRSVGREVLAKSLGTLPQHIDWNTSGPPEISVNGKPAGCAVSISHSGAVSAMAMAPAEWQIGVDIEMQPENFNWKALAAVALTSAEQEALQAVHAKSQPALLLDSWTLKEAILKCLRTMPVPEARAVRIVWESGRTRFPQEIHLDDSRSSPPLWGRQGWGIACFQSELLAETVSNGISGQKNGGGARSGALAVYRAVSTSPLTHVARHSEQLADTEVANGLKFSRIELTESGIKWNSGVFVDLLVATI